MENKFYLFSSKLSPEIGGVQIWPPSPSLFPKQEFWQSMGKGKWGRTLTGRQSWLLSKAGPACVLFRVLSCPRAADSHPKMSAWDRPGLFCFVSWWSGPEDLRLLMDMEQGSFWDLHVTALGCVRNGGGSPWTRSTGDSAVSGGTQGIMQNSSEKPVLLHQVRRDEQWKRICSREIEERSFRKNVSLIDNFPGKTGNHTQDKTESVLF